MKSCNSCNTANGDLRDGSTHQHDQEYTCWASQVPAHLLKTDCKDDYKDCEAYRYGLDCTMNDADMCPWCPKFVEIKPTMQYGDGEESVDGLKYDVHKTDMTFLADWDLALQEICKLSAFGAEKYERGGWTKITEPERLKACMLRHYFKEKYGQEDADSGVLHDVAVAWNALSALQVRLQNDRREECGI